PTLYLRLSAARCACAAPMNETGPFSPKTSAAPALPRTRSRREISNIALPPCLVLVDPSPTGPSSFGEHPHRLLPRGDVSIRQGSRGGGRHLAAGGGGYGPWGANSRPG